jgi:outer membrane protein assembly factor BamB
MVPVMHTPLSLLWQMAAWICLPAAALGTPAAQTPGPTAWPLAETARLTYEGEINQRAVAEGTRLYFTTRRGWIYAVDAEHRVVSWRFGADAPILRPPSVSAALIAAVDEANTVYCLTVGGALNWVYHADSPAACEPAWLGPRLIVALRGGPLLALSAGHPGELWRVELEKGLVRSMAVWRDRILCACGDGLVRMYGPDGSPAGTVDAGGSLSGTLTIDGDRVYAGRQDGFLCCLEPAKGSVSWRMRIGGELTAPVLVDGRRLFLTASNGVLFAINKNGGDILWWRPLPSRMVFGPVLWQERIVAASASPALSSFRPRTGEPLGEFRGTADWKADPQGRGGLLLLHTFDPDAREGTLLFLSPIKPAPAKTGTPIKGAKSP